MIIVSLLGTDPYSAIGHTQRIHKGLCQIYGIDEDELEFFAPESFIIHNGMEQTSYHLNIRVEAPYDCQDREETVVDYLKNAFKDLAIHIRILFSYFDPDHEYVFFDPDYPRFMTQSNVVKADIHDSEETADMAFDEKEEPYMGDIIGEFDAYVKAHPDATDREVYEALTGIRKDVNDRHKNKKEN